MRSHGINPVMLGEREARGKSIRSVKKRSIFTKWILFPSRRSAARPRMTMHDALVGNRLQASRLCDFELAIEGVEARTDRKSTRLNSSHQIISYAVFCLKKKNNEWPTPTKTITMSAGRGRKLGEIVSSGPH